MGWGRGAGDAVGEEVDFKRKVGSDLDLDQPMLAENVDQAVSFLAPMATKWPMVGPGERRSCGTSSR